MSLLSWFLPAVSTDSSQSLSRSTYIRDISLLLGRHKSRNNRRLFRTPLFHPHQAREKARLNDILVTITIVPLHSPPRERSLRRHPLPAILRSKQRYLHCKFQRVVEHCPDLPVENIGLMAGEMIEMLFEEAAESFFQTNTEFSGALFGVKLGVDVEFL